MNKSLIFLLLALGLLATTASAFNTPVLKKSLYIRDWVGRTLYDMFRTKDATISFSTDHPNFHEVDPTYRILGFSPANVTEILEELSQDCDNVPYMDSRITYYERNDSLLYFCLNNKSLLVLDSHKFTVQKSIPLNFDFPNLEMTKLYLENDSLVILLVKTIHNSQDIFANTVFIRVNLTSQQVTQNLVLDQGFGSFESVVAYVGNGTNSYVLANVFSGSLKQILLYSFNANGNDYNVKRLYSETLNFRGKDWDDLSSQLYVAGDLVITNNNDSVLFFNNQGQLLSKAENLTLYQVDFEGWTKIPAFFEGRNKTFYYESLGGITQFTVQGTSVKAKFLVAGTKLQVARGSSQQGDLVFYLQDKKLVDDSDWYVLDVDASKIISQVPKVYNNIFTSDITYGVLANKTISIFYSSNDTFITKVKTEISIDNFELFYFYDAEHSYFYYLRFPVLSSKCDLLQIDIRTGASRTLSTLSGGNLCAGRITQVNSSSLDFIIEDKNGGYYINSASYGQVNFTYTLKILYKGFAAVNFDDLSVNLIHYPLTTRSWNHSFYTFDNRSRSFTVQNSSKIADLGEEGVFLFNYFGGPKVFFTWLGYSDIIDLNTNAVDVFRVQRRELVPTRLYGNSEYEGFILTDKDGIVVGPPSYYNQTSNQLGSLPTQKVKSIDARASGRCRYYQANAFIESGASETVVDIYDFCSGGSSEKVPFLKKFMRRYGAL